MPEKFEIRPLRDEPLGAEVIGVSPRMDFTEDELARIKGALASHHALVIRGEGPRDEKDVLRCARRFGVMMRTPGLEDSGMMELSHNPDHPAHALKANDFEWHTDGINADGVIGKETFLEALKPSKLGGHTYLVSTYEVYEALPHATKARLDGILAVHDAGAYKKQAKFTSNLEPNAHPLVVTHPDSGRRCLLFTPYTTAGFVGLPGDEGDQLFLELIDRILQPGRVYRHAWQEHDLLLFDIVGTWHRRDAWDPKLEDRRMRMCSVWYEAPVFAAPPNAPTNDPDDETQYRYGVGPGDLDQREAALAWARRQVARNRAAADHP